MKRNYRNGTRWLKKLCLLALAVGLAAPVASVAQEEEGIGDTGTDPRDFAAKFMPYYRYTELENGLEQLPEFQTIKDFENDHFSWWIGPEIGKLLAPGRILYVKPGWGISPDEDSGDRDFSVEVGFRWFF